MMLEKGKRLAHDVDFHNAMILGVPVIVWQDGEILDYGGSIERYDEEVVVINEVFYVRSTCEFRVR